MKSCKNCVFFWRDGTGYSDYTWEDTEARCFLGLNPGLPKSEAYDGDLPELNFAEACITYKESYPSDGKPPCISPDGNLSEGEERVARLIRETSK